MINRRSTAICSLQNILFITLIYALSVLGVVSHADDEGKPAFIDGDAYLQFVADSITEVSTDELLLFLQKHPDSEFLDVRLPHEIAAQGGFIDAGRRTHQIPRGWLEFRIGDTVPDLETPLVVYCSTNRRSPLAAYTLQQMGYDNIVNYKDGFLAWKDQGFDVEPTDYAVGNQLYRKPVMVAPGIY